jgi:hypothetical protein
MARSKQTARHNRPPRATVFMENILHNRYGKERASQMMKDFNANPDKPEFSNVFQAALTKFNNAYNEFNEFRIAEMKKIQEDVAAVKKKKAEGKYCK